MIFITGASGKTGRAIISALARRGARMRALVRRPEQVGAVHNAGADEVIVGDLHDGDLLKQAVLGADRVYHICPNVSPDEVEIGRQVILAAREAGVGHFVYHSVLHPQTEAMPHHWKKLLVEEALLESRLPFTILQPAAYMQNTLAQWALVVNEGRYLVPYATRTRLGMVDLEDVAEAAAHVLTEQGHTGAIYELAGAEALTQDEVAAVFAEKLGRPVQAETTPLDVWEQRSRASGMPEYAVQTLLRMFCYYERYDFWGNPRVLAWLIGRQPASFADFVEREVRVKIPGGS